MEVVVEEQIGTAYEMLGVEETATISQIRTAYRKRQLQCHPDKNPDMPEKANRIAKRIAQAYEILMQHRTEYDAYLAEQRGQTSQPQETQH